MSFAILAGLEGDVPQVHLDGGGLHLYASQGEFLDKDFGAVVMRLAHEMMQMLSASGFGV
jgi:hypothetical protein